MYRIAIFLLYIISVGSCTSEPIGKEQQKFIQKIDITTKAEEALAYVESKGMNTDFCILIDFSLHSGYKRFFIWDFNAKRVVESFMVSHGAGNHSWSGTSSKDDPTFSNEDGSHLSSLGKYQIGERGWSNWGIHIKYLMHGLEETNSNALKRVIVLHSWELVTNEETYPEGTPEGWGCPAVSNEAMETIDGYLKGVEKPVLLWIYNE